MTADLSTSYLGMDLANPLVASSSLDPALADTGYSDTSGRFFLTGYRAGSSSAGSTKPEPSVSSWEPTWAWPIPALLINI